MSCWGFVCGVERRRKSTAKCIRCIDTDVLQASCFLFRYNSIRHLAASQPGMGGNVAPGIMVKWEVLIFFICAKQG